MRCPKCLERLTRLTKFKRYQTLSEHGSNPNAVSPPRPAYTCPNGCNDGLGYYGYEGGFYATPMAGIKSKLECAINSLAWQVEYDYSDWLGSHYKMTPEGFAEFMASVDEVMEGE